MPQLYQHPWTPVLKLFVRHLARSKRNATQALVVLACDEVVAAGLKGPSTPPKALWGTASRVQAYRQSRARGRCAGWTGRFSRHTRSRAGP
jgi:hypothetical protein